MQRGPASLMFALFVFSAVGSTPLALPEQVGAASPGLEAVKPEWKVGNYWEYAVKMGIGSAEHHMEGTLKLTVTGTEYAPINNTMYSCHRLTGSGAGRGRGEYNGIAADYDCEISGYILFTTDTVALAKMHFVYSVYFDLPLIKPHVDLDMDMTFSPPLDMFDFPVRVGETWSAKSMIYTDTTLRAYQGGTPTNVTSEKDSGEVNMTTHALGAGRKTVGAGTFATLYGNTSGGPSGGGELFSWYSEDAGMIVRSEGRNETGAVESYFDLKSYSYTPPPKAVVGTSSGDLGARLTQWWVFVVLGVAVACAIIVLFYVSKRRRRKMARPPRHAKPAVRRVGKPPPPPEYDE